MSLVQTAVTTTALVWAIGTYMMQMYGAYTAQQANIHDSTGQAGHEVDAGYVVGGTCMNVVLTLYLLYYIYAIRYEKHGDVFKLVGTLLLLTGLVVDIFLSVFVVQLAQTTADKQVWEAYGWMYGIGTINFFIRLFLIIQFQCSDVLARRVLKPGPTMTEQVKKAILPGNTGPQQGQRPDRGPNPFVKTEEGGRRRRRR